MRYTDLFFTIDTHVAPESDEDQVRVTNLLTRTIREFLSAAVLKAVLLCEDPTKLRRVVPSGGSVELGDKYNRIHAHFNLSVAHETNVYLKHPDGRTLNTVVADWFNTKLEPETGRACYARVTLADSSRAKNYAAKSSSAPGATSVPSFGVSNARGAVAGAVPPGGVAKN